ncbi:MAG: hypothetical protein RBT78_10420 [Kiritimatiellia bacterium]|nr:hypothetical protein [Kiritimatiellia bacterium]
MALGFVVRADIVQFLQLADNLFPFIRRHQNRFAFLVLVDNVFWIHSYHVITTEIVSPTCASESTPISWSVAPGWAYGELALGECPHFWAGIPACPTFEAYALLHHFAAVGGGLTHNPLRATGARRRRHQ